MKFDGCIAHPCPTKRAKGIGFCPEHKETHVKSLWVKAWKAYQEQCAKVGVRNAVFSPPKRKENGS